MMHYHYKAQYQYNINIKTVQSSLFIQMIGFQVFKVLTLFLLIGSCCSQSVKDLHMWKQCDPQWANDQLGFSNSDTICSAGCLMTSATMIVTSLPAWVNPKIMNQWLRDHGGYAYGDSFVWASIQPFGLAFGGLDPNPVYRIALHLQAGDFVIANVMGGAHWVLATSVSNGYMSVNDPGFNKAGYGINEVVQFGWYSRTRLPINMGNWITGIREILGLRQKRNQIATRVEAHKILEQYKA